MSRVRQGVSFGIAAYKACELTRLLVRAGHEVTPLLTPRAELLVVAPATANTIAKLALGLADNLVTEAALAHAGPILVAPAMNVRMWEHPATQANVALLRERDVHLVGPEEGEL